MRKYVIPLPPLHTCARLRSPLQCWWAFMRSQRSRQTLSSAPPTTAASTTPARVPRLTILAGFAVNPLSSCGSWAALFKPASHSHAVAVPRSFIKMTLGAPTGVDVDQLKAENEQLRKKCDEFTLKLEDVQAKLAEAEGSGEA